MVSVVLAGAAATRAAPQSITLPEVAGVWHVQTMIGPKDSVVATLDLSQTSNDAGWTMTFPGRAPIPVRVVALGGDSIVWQAGPYTSTRRVGQTVMLRTVGHYKGDEMWGTFEADYSVSGKTSGKVTAKRTK